VCETSDRQPKLEWLRVEAAVLSMRGVDDKVECLRKRRSAEEMSGCKGVDDPS